MAEATVFRLQALEEDVRKLLTDMYTGAGEQNRPMTVRMADLEKSVATILADGKATRQMMLGTLLTVFAGIVSAFVCYKLGIRI